MDKQDRITVLKSYRRDFTGGPVFKSHQDCIDWTHKIGPVLDFDAALQSEFMEHARYMLPAQLSVDRRMTHMRGMDGVIARAIWKLEHGVPSKDADEKPEGTRKPFHPFSDGWVKYFWAPIGVLVVGGLILAYIVHKNGWAN